MTDDLEAAERYLGVRAREIELALSADPPDPVLRAVIESALLHMYALRIRPSQQSRWAKSRRDSGLCILCGSPAWRTGSPHCLKHKNRISRLRRKKRNA